MNALEEALKAIPPASSDREAFRRATIVGLMHGYDCQWRPSNPEYYDWEIQTIEEDFELPIFNPDTGKPLRGLRQVGRFDGRIRGSETAASGVRGRPYLLEHKTVSSLTDLGFDAPY